MTRGEIYRIRLPRVRGREQRGTRFGVIVQADEFLGLSAALVAPTSRNAAPATFRPEVTIDGYVTRVLVEQIRALDLDRLGQLSGRLTHTEQAAVDDAMLLVLGLG